MAAISLRNLVHSVLALAVAFTGLAAVYLQLSAQFIGFAQILVYVGAVLILIVFAILITRDTGATSQSIVSGSWVGDGAVVLAIFGTLAWAILHSPASRPLTTSQPEATMQQIGRALMMRFSLPLEIIGLLLTAALIGAATIALREKKEIR
ncbi:MAG: NADH-quinone oxidoreductase subunit J [Edaphobacter sp.]